jgi:hypothetical protein
MIGVTYYMVLIDQHIIVWVSLYDGLIRYLEKSVCKNAVVFFFRENNLFALMAQ